jgi:hypothetical protein
MGLSRGWKLLDKNGFYSYDTQTFKIFTEKDGLVYTSVRSVLADKRGIFGLVLGVLD